MGADYKPLLRARRFDRDIFDVAVVQNVWLNLLTEAFATILDVQFRMTAVGETIEANIVADGETLTVLAFNAIANTDYRLTWRLAPYSAQTHLEWVTTAHGFGFLLEGNDVAINIRKTTNNGAGNVQAIVLHQN